MSPEQALGQAVDARTGIVERFAGCFRGYGRREQIEHPGGFDLIIGTNVFVYFGEFEQLLARLNMALMLNRGGWLVSNDRLPDSAADGRVESLQTVQVIAHNPDRTDYMFSYKRH